MTTETMHYNAGHRPGDCDERCTPATERYAVNDGHQLTDNGRPMLTLVRAVWGDDAPPAAELDAITRAIPAALNAADGIGRPVAVVDITGGVPQWIMTAPGTGEPEVIVLDFDDEADIEWRAANLAEYERAYSLLLAAGAPVGDMPQEIERERSGLTEQWADYIAAGGTCELCGGVHGLTDCPQRATV